MSSLSLRRPQSRTYQQRELLLNQDAVPISNFVNQDFESPLQIKYVNFNIEQNGFIHKTSFYAHMKDLNRNALIVRRGQPFRITIGLSRKFCQRDYVTLVFYNRDLCKRSEELIQDNGVTSISQKARVVTLRATFGNKTKTIVPIIATSHYSIKSSSKWDAVCDYVGNDFIHVLVQTAEDCIIGRWLMSICIENDDQLKWFHESRRTTIYVLFNCYCKGDNVFLEESTDRSEYVEETMGIIFIGCDQHVMVNFCNYSHFDDPVLEFALETLLTTELDFDLPDRNRATKVVQVLAHEILKSGKFLKYVPKNAEDPWTSGARVLAEYWKKKKPVVYNDRRTAVIVLSSIFRSLGIPARPVSGYSIPTNEFIKIKYQPPKDILDKRGSQTSLVSTASNRSARRKSSSSRRKRSKSTSSISSAKNVTGKKKTFKSQDFVIENLKPYEPWVEVHTTRRDLIGDVFKGWQAVTAEGPCSVAAVQDCAYLLQYGTLSLAKSVNNIYAFYTFNNVFKSFVPHNEAPGRIATAINTKRPGLDVFSFMGFLKNYKCEPEVLHEACKFGFRQEVTQIIRSHDSTPANVKPYFIGSKLQGLTFHMTPVKNVKLGEPILVHVFAASSDHRDDWHAAVSINIFAIDAEGNLLKRVKNRVMTINRMTEGGSAKLTVPYSEYSSKIRHGGTFRVITIAWGCGITEGFYVMDDFFIMSIPTPNLLVNKDSITVGLVNTLPIPMKNATLSMFELGDSRPNVKLKVPMLVEANGKVGRYYRLKHRSKGEVHRYGTSNISTPHFNCNKDIQIIIKNYLHPLNVIPTHHGTTTYQAR